MTQFFSQTQPQLATENWLNLLRFSTQTTLITRRTIDKKSIESNLADLLSSVGLSGVVTSNGFFLFFLFQISVRIPNKNNCEHPQLSGCWIGRFLRPPAAHASRRVRARVPPFGAAAASVCGAAPILKGLLPPHPNAAK